MCNLDRNRCSFKHLQTFTSAALNIYTTPSPYKPKSHWFHAQTGSMTEKWVWELKKKEKKRQKIPKMTATWTHPQKPTVNSMPTVTWHKFLHLYENTHMKSRVLTSTKENFWHFQKTNLRLCSECPTTKPTGKCMLSWELPHRLGVERNSSTKWINICLHSRP